jgi:hypothetical protein
MDRWAATNARLLVAVGFVVLFLFACGYDGD